MGSFIGIGNIRFLHRWTRPWLYGLSDYIDQQKLVKSAKPIIFDVGANIGQTTEKYFYHFPNSNIHAFEPFDDASNIFINKFKDNKNVRLNKLALADKKGVHEFYLNKCHYTNSLLETVSVGNRVFHDNDDQLTGIKKIKIKTETLDNYCKTKKVKRINILKMDVQGGELKVLMGAKHMLKKKAIDVIFSEVEFVEMYKSQPLFDDLVIFLRKYGYDLYNLYNLSHSSNGRLLGGDAIFIRSDLKL